jgi:hypothetical protein
MAGTPIYDAMGNYTGVTDPGAGEEKPSPAIAKPAAVKVTDPVGGPIIVAAQIKLGKWTIYAEGEKLFAKSPDGKKLQLQMFEPTGVTQSVKPNKVSDGSDGSKGASLGNTATTGRTVPTVEPSGGLLGGLSKGFPSGALNINGVLNTISGVLATVAAVAGIFNVIKSLFSANNQSGRPAAEAYLGRTIPDEDWNNLVAVTYAEAGSDPQEQAWVMGTILNRCRQSGASVIEIINQPNQFVSVTGDKAAGTNVAVVLGKFELGPSPSVEANINSAVVNFISSVPTNNYYFNAVSKDAPHAGDCYCTQRNGVQGVLVGQSLVYPSAKWP